MTSAEKRRVFTGMKLEIETAKWEDYQEVAALMQTVHDIHCQGRPDIYREAEHFYKEDDYKADLVNPRELLLVARGEEDVAGICQVNFASVKGSDGFSVRRTKSEASAFRHRTDR